MEVKSVSSLLIIITAVHMNYNPPLHVIVDVLLWDCTHVFEMFVIFSIAANIYPYSNMSIDYCLYELIVKSDVYYQ